MSRIHEIVTLPPENDKAQSAEVPAEWPSRGEIVFDDVKLQYKYVSFGHGAVPTEPSIFRPDLPHAIRGVSFRVRPGSKIGICGRSG